MLQLMPGMSVCIAMVIGRSYHFRSESAYSTIQCISSGVQRPVRMFA